MRLANCRQDPAAATSRRSSRATAGSGCAKTCSVAKTPAAAARARSHDWVCSCALRGDPAHVGGRGGCGAACCTGGRRVLATRREAGGGKRWMGRGGLRLGDKSHQWSSGTSSSEDAGGGRTLAKAAIAYMRRSAVGIVRAPGRFPASCGAHAGRRATVGAGGGVRGPVGWC